jgi:hypothetical protein
MPVKKATEEFAFPGIPGSWRRVKRNCDNWTILLEEYAYFEYVDIK